MLDRNDPTLRLITAAGRRLYSVLSGPAKAVVSNVPKWRPGSSPGIEALLGQEDVDAPQVEVHIQCLDYADQDSQFYQVDDLEAFLEAPRPDWVRVRWISVTGFTPRTVDQFRRAYGFHTLASEDTLNTTQRPKLDDYGNHLYAVIRMLEKQQQTLRTQQVSIFCTEDTVVSFQEQDSSVWEPIERRIANPDGRFRQQNASYLLYALLDAVVDHGFPILEFFADELEELENEALTGGDRVVLRSLYGIKRDLVLLRRFVWPMREVAENLRRSDNALVSDHVRDFARDLLDHSLQLIDIVESLREAASSLTDLVLSLAGNRMNEVMKVLTIMASLFIPITFLAGVYGMNFQHIPELGWEYAYPVFWIICITVTVGLLIFFRRRRWL